MEQKIIYTKEEYRRSCLSKAQDFHQKFLSSGEKRFWEKFLNWMWVSSCLDLLEDSFWEERQFLKKKRVDFLENSINAEQRYQKSLGESLFQAKLGLPVDGYGSCEVCIDWCEICLENSKLREIELMKRKKRLDPGFFSGNDFEKAKQFPIKELLPFRGNYTKCLWHNEKTPSLYLYEKENRVHCFSCGKHADVIDVAQVIWGCSFQNAVRRLST